MTVNPRRRQRKISRSFSLRGKMSVEPIFYSDSGAFDFQYLDMAPDKYGRDSHWLATNAGISIDRLILAATELRKLQVQRVQHYQEASTHHEKCSAALTTFSFTRSDLSFMTDQEFAAFLEKFAVTPGEVAYAPMTVGDLNEFDYRPIVRLDRPEPLHARKLPSGQVHIR